MKKAKLLATLVAAALAIGWAGPALGQDQAAQAEEDLAKQAQNPIANIISLPFQNNTSFKVGDLDRTQNVLNVQPVIPITLGSRVNLITRTIIPILYQPDIFSPTASTTGLGDINASFMFSPSRASKVTWGVGPIIYFPTATDSALGSGRWSLGPSFVALTMPGNWVIGGLVNNAWSVGEADEGEADINSFLFQYFVNYNMANGWYLTSAPIWTANWEAEPGNRWIIPMGGGFGRIFRIGSQNFNGQFQAFYNVKTIDPGTLGPGTPQIVPPGGLPPEYSSSSSWSIRFQLQMLFPK